MNAGHRLEDDDQARLDQCSRDPDRAMATHRQEARGLDVEHAPVGLGSGRGLENGTGHRGMPVGFPHKQAAQVVEVLFSQARRSAIVLPGTT